MYLQVAGRDTERQSLQVATPNDAGIETANQSNEKVRKASCLQQSVKLLIKSTPYKSTVGRIGSTSGKRCGILWSLLLAALLITIAVLFSFSAIINIPKSFAPTQDLCVDSGSQANAYLNEYRNMTGYYQLKDIGSLSKNITADLYQQALQHYNSRYVVSNDSGNITSSGTKWPSPHQQSEAELLALSQRDCSMKVCIDSSLLSVLCTTVSYPCPLSLDVEGVYFGGSGEFGDSQEHNASDIAYSNLSSELQSQMIEILERTNYIAGFYVLYMAAMIFVGAPYVITSRKLFPTKIQFAASLLSKPWFILIILMLWYSTEIVQFLWNFLFIQTDLLSMLQFSIADPCFADTDFLKTLYTEGASICADIEYSQKLYEASVSNLAYYESVEGTYNYYYWASDLVRSEDDQIPYGEEDKLFADDTLSAAPYYLWWDDQNVTECSISTMLSYIGPSDASFDFSSLLLLSGAFFSLLLQPILANLVQTIFVLIDPLSPYFGRIEIPFKLEQQLDQHHGQAAQWKVEWEQFKKECADKKLLRVKAICPLIVWVILLALIFTNLAANQAF